MFVIVDGLDGVGKGVIIDALASYEKDCGKKIFDLEDYWQKRKAHPEPWEFKSYEVLLSAEPTRVWVGEAIRQELIANGKEYPVRLVASAFSIDRMILYKKIVLPALAYGLIVFQNRSVVSSMTYQLVQAKQAGENVDLEFILGLEGNKFALNYPPNLLIIPTIANVREVIDRLAAREKKDHAIFENLDFQLRLKEMYESKELKSFFESRGTVVKYLDAGISELSTREQAIKIWKDFLKSRV